MDAGTDALELVVLWAELPFVVLGETDDVLFEILGAVDGFNDVVKCDLVGGPGESEATPPLAP